MDVCSLTDKRVLAAHQTAQCTSPDASLLPRSLHETQVSAGIFFMTNAAYEYVGHASRTASEQNRRMLCFPTTGTK